MESGDDCRKFMWMLITDKRKVREREQTVFCARKYNEEGGTLIKCDAEMEAQLDCNGGSAHSRYDIIKRWGTHTSEPGLHHTPQAQVSPSMSAPTHRRMIATTDIIWAVSDLLVDSSSEESVEKDFVVVPLLALSKQSNKCKSKDQRPNLLEFCSQRTSRCTGCGCL